MKFFLPKTILCSFLLIGFFSTHKTIAQTTLSPGDIAIIGINYDVVPYEMTIVNLVPVSAGTVIRITDYGYDEATGTFGTTSVANTAEGSITWTLTSAMPAGTVTKLSITGGATPNVSGLPGTVSVTGWTFANTASCPVSSGGDNWFIFQGSSPTSVSQFVFAWVNTFAVVFFNQNQPAGQFIPTGNGNQPNNNNSYLPPSLTLGSTAIALNRDPSQGGYHGDNNVYNGIKSGTKAVILAAIGNKDNWLINEGPAATVNPGSVYDISAGGAYFPGVNPVFNVIATNTAPTDIALSVTSINENVTANSVVGTFSTTDPDAANTFTYTLVAGTGSTDNAAFTISGSDLKINASPDFETKSSYSVRIRTTDQGSLTFEKVFTITVNNVNEAPTNITLSATSINENVTANSVVGTFSSTDPDAANNFTYTLVAGTGSTDNDAFTISGSDLKINASPDFETKSSYSVRIRTTDQGSLTFEKVFTITVNNINEAPTNITLSATSINENVTANSVVGTFSSTDPDATNNFTYTLVAGTGSTDNDAFTISGSDLKINASPDFETKSSYSVRIRTTDQSGLFFEKTFTISINDLCDIATPAITTTGSTTFCIGKSVVLTSSSTTGNVWSTGEKTPLITVSNGGTYTVVVTINGCSSAVSAGKTVTVNSLPSAATTVKGATISADLNGANYQWFECANVGKILATTQSFTPTSSGDYGVIVSSNNCDSTSICKNIKIVVTAFEADANSDHNSISIYPNPSSDFIHLEFKEIVSGTISISDLGGNIVYSKAILEKDFSVSTDNFAEGIYVLSVSSNLINTTQKLTILK